MPSQPVTFPCPFCTRRMGVPAELLGRQVRCPHCKQVVVAPASAGPAPAPAPGPVAVSPPAPPPAPEPEPELRPFNIPQQKEGADSILSEPDESDDEVFGSNPGVRLRAIEPEPPPPAPPESPSPNPFGPGTPAPVPVNGDVVPKFLTGTVVPFPPPAAPAPVPVSAPKPAPAPAPIPVSTAKQEPLDPFSDLEAVVAPAPKPEPKPAAAQPAPIPVPAPARPAPAPLPVPITPAPAPGGGNPFATFDAPPEPVKAKAPKTAPAIDDLPEDEAPPKKKKSRKDAEEPEEKPARGAYGRADAGSGGGGKVILLVLLAGYAFVATLLAVYGLFFSSGAPAGHPLSTIPDNFGEFDPVSRKKVSRAAFPVDGPLPPAQRAALGDKINIGQLEVQPVKVEKRALVLDVEDTSGKEKRKIRTAEKALVLTLDIKNTSPDLAIFPMDPAFTRREGKDDQPGTRLVTGKRAFFGGEIEWPLPGAVKKKIEVQQANDAIPLKPGESREYVVFTAARAEVARTAEAEQGPLQWRVQLRRGLIEYRGKEIPVTAIIGVDFKATDIQGAE